MFLTLGTITTIQHARAAKEVASLRTNSLPFALQLGQARATHSAFLNRLEAVPESGRIGEQRIAWMKAVISARKVTMRRLRKSLKASEKDALESQSGDYALINAAFFNIESQLKRSESDYQSLWSNEDTERTTLLGRLREREQAIAKSYRHAWSSLQVAIATLSNEIAERESRTTWVIATFSFLGLLLGFGGTWWIARLLRPLPLLESRAITIAEGKTPNVGDIAYSRDEIGRLAEAFDEMVNALQRRDESIREKNRIVTQLQELQERILFLLSDAVFVLEGENIQVANPAAKNLLGVEAGNTLTTNLHEIRLRADEALQYGHPIRLEESAFANKKMNLTFTPFDIQNGRTLIVAEDVTDALATKARLIENEKLAAVGRMAAHVTHEVRNPLSSIGLNIEMLSEDLEKENHSAQNLVAAIHREVERLRELTDHYLKLARLPTPQRKEIQIDRYLQELGTFVQAEMLAAKCKLTYSLENDVVANIDINQIRQAMLNILRNARESMPSGGTIEVALKTERDFLYIEVSDEGVGFPEDANQRAFDIFFTTKEHGTGLGLPLTQQIVFAHGGTISWRARKHRGTTVTMRLPRS